MDYTDLYIDGEWRKTAERFDVINPATEEVLASVASADLADADAALDAAEARHGGLGRAEAARTLRGAAPRVGADDRSGWTISPISSRWKTARRARTRRARQPMPPSSSAGSPKRPCAPTA
jgi:hypothetical protein